MNCFKPCYKWIFNTVIGRRNKSTKLLTIKNEPKKDSFQ